MESLKPQDYRADIDGLRAISVIIVMLFHAQIVGFSGGFIGVDVFFVISGFLITGHLKNELLNKGTISFFEFYARRIKRLFPAIFTVLSFIIFCWWLYFYRYPKETQIWFDSLKSSLLTIANFYFKNNSGDYFMGPSHEMPLLHFWSLAVEEQFYFVWPFILIASQWKIPFLKNLTSLSKMKLVLFIITFFSFAFSEWFILKNKSLSSFYLMPTRAWELGLGGLSSLYFQEIHSFLKKFKGTLTFLSLCGLGLIAFCTFTYSEDTRFPGLLAFLPVLGASLIILSGSQKRESKFLSFLASPLFVWLGQLSYGLYLWHWPLLALNRIYQFGDVSQVSDRIYLLLASLLLAWLTLNFVEKPIRKINLFSSPQKTFSTFIVLSLMLFTLGFLVNKKAQHYRQEHIIFFNKLDTGTKEAKKCFDKPKRWGTDTCLFGDKKAKHEIFVLGNSHSRAAVPMVEDYMKNSNQSLKMSVVSSAFTVGNAGFGLFHAGNVKKEYLTFNKHLENVLKLRLEDKNISRSLIIASRFTKGLCLPHISVRENVYCMDKKNTFEGSLDVLKKSLRNTIEIFHSKGFNKILIMKPWPEFSHYSIDCYTNPKACKMDREKFDSYAHFVNDIIDEIQKEFPYVRSFDPKDYLCNDKTCIQFQKLKPDSDELYPIVMDDDHATIDAAKYVGQKINGLLLWNTEK